MGLDMCLAQKRLLKWKQIEDTGRRIASVGGVCLMAEVLSRLYPQTVQLMEKDPRMKEGLADFLSYLKSNSQARLRRFNGYIDFVNRANAQMRAMAGEGAEMLLGMTKPASAAHFADEVKIFMGGFILSNEPKPEKEVNAVLNYLLLQRALVESHAQLLAQTNPEKAEMLNDVEQMLACIIDLSKQAQARRVGVYFDC